MSEHFTAHLRVTRVTKTPNRQADPYNKNNFEVLNREPIDLVNLTIRRDSLESLKEATKAAIELAE